MPKYTGKWPYEKLQAGDWVCCGGLGVFSAITRVVTGGGWKAWRNRKISTHTGILFTIGKQLLVGEMCASGIEVNSLEVKYRKRTERVMCFRRPLVKNAEVYRTAVNDAIGLLVRKGMEYDPKGLFAFIDTRVRDNPDRMYCSEMVHSVARDHVLVPFPEGYEICVSPEQLHTCAQAETVWVP